MLSKCLAKKWCKEKQYDKFKKRKEKKLKVQFFQQTKTITRPERLALAEGQVYEERNSHIHLQHRKRSLE